MSFQYYVRVNVFLERKYYLFGRWMVEIFYQFESVNSVRGIQPLRSLLFTAKNNNIGVANGEKKILSLLPTTECGKPSRRYFQRGLPILLARRPIGEFSQYNY